MRQAPGARGAAGPLLVGALVGAMVAGRLETGLLCLAIAAGIAVALRAPWPSWRWRVSLLTSAVLGMALNLYLNPGAPLGGSWPRLFGRAPTVDGLEMGALLSIRLLGAMAAIQGLRAAWPGEQAADAMARLLAPLQRLRVPVREMRVMIGLALRFAPLLERESRRIARVQDLRAGRPPRNGGEWMQRRRAALVPTMVSALERAERVALALEARGYAGRPVVLGAGSGRAARASGVLGVMVAATAALWRS